MVPCWRRSPGSRSLFRRSPESARVVIVVPEHGVAAERSGDARQPLGERIYMAGLQHHEVTTQEHNIWLCTIQGIACRSPQVWVCGGPCVEVGSEGDP